VSQHSLSGLQRWIVDRDKKKQCAGLKDAKLRERWPLKHIND